MLDELKTHIGVNSSKPLEAGCFEAVLEMVLEEALQKPRKDFEFLVRNLVDQVLQADQAMSSEDKIKTKEPMGGVEYRRPQRRQSENPIGSKKPQLGD